MAKHLIVFIVFLLFAIMLTNTAYGMWYEKLKVNAKITMGSYDLKITSQKFLCENCTADSSFVDILNDGKRAKVFISNAEPNSSIWVGLVLSNEGTLPLRLVQVNVLGCNNFEAYVYGPFRSPGQSGVWGKVRIDDLPFPHDEGLPSPVCDPSMKLIVWINIVAPATGYNETECLITLTSELAI